jgi:hypothetical protein
MLAAPHAGAATVGVAWDPVDTPGVTGYRVYVGTAPGQQTEVFDIGPFQTTFVYTKGFEGQRYYFSVATRLGAVLSARSAEVSGRATSAVATVLGVPSIGPDASKPTSAAGGTSHELAGGLGAVSSFDSAVNGTSVFIEGASRVRVLTPRGLSAVPALEAAEGERFVSLALAPDFVSSGHVYLAVEAALPGGVVELRVVRARLVGTALGEAAAVIVIAGGAGETVLATSAGGHLFVSQPGGVSRYGLDGTVPRDQPAALWNRVDLRPLAARWDAAGGGLWVLGRGPSGDVESRFVRDGAVAAGPVLVARTGSLSQVNASVVSGRVLGHVVAGSTLTTVDLASAAASRIDASVSHNKAEAMTMAPGGETYLVIQRAGASPGSFALLRYPSQTERASRAGF